MKKILFIALTFAVALFADARANRQLPVIEEGPKAVPADSFSYAIGVVQAQSLKQYLQMQENVSDAEMEYFIEGLTSTISDDAQKRENARVAGYKIAKMNSERIVPSINKSFTGKEDSTYLDEKIFVNGIVDALRGKAEVADSVAQQTVERQQNYYLGQIKNAQLAWLDNNKKIKGVKTLPSGLQYKVIKEGNGAVPTADQEVEVNYEGKLIDGTVFDSSYKRNKPSSFKCNQVIKGWTEALTMMPVGSEWELYIPYDLAYGEQGNRNIPPYATLIFKVELLNIK